MGKKKAKKYFYNSPMLSIIEKIIALSQKRISYFHTVENVKNWYQGSATYIE